MTARPERDCHVLVENDNKSRYIRRGLNQNQGAPQHDCFILRRDGAVEGAIDWNYDSVTRIEARPIGEKPLVLRDGVFTTFANRMKQEVDYNYWSRNIVITRSNTEIDGLTHYFVGETGRAPLCRLHQRSPMRQHYIARLLRHWAQNLFDHRISGTAGQHGFVRL